MADVICPNCGDRYHETTDEFVLGKITTGNMLRLKQFYVDNGWDSFPEIDAISWGDLECPGCGGAYADTGRVKIDMAQYNAEKAAEMAKFLDGYEPELPPTKVEKRRPGRPKSK